LYLQQLVLFIHAFFYLQELYFSSYHRGSKKIVAGRLSVKFHNTRRKLIAVGLIPKATLQQELLIEEGLG
jgi:hypothetical protein